MSDRRPAVNRENLEKLANYLLALPNGYGEFDMADYSDVHIKKWSCGTVGCAAGHGPKAGILPTEEQLERAKGGDYEWDDYVDDHFVGYGAPSVEVWFWCFDSAWATVDNTPRGAGLRIKWYLAKGLPEPHIKCNMMSGALPLCYLEEPAGE